MHFLPVVLLTTLLMTGCNFPLRYQDTEHYKSRLQAQSDRRMQEHLRVEATYIERAKIVASQVEKVGAGSVLEAAQNQVAESLKDPESAKFKRVRFVMHEGGALICGEVNAKNSYGGYVGYLQFLSDSEVFEIYDTKSKDEKYTTKITSKCSAPIHQVFLSAITQ